jgi:hypothetical protein
MKIFVEEQEMSIIIWEYDVSGRQQEINIDAI